MAVFKMCYPGGKLRALTFSYDDGLPEDARLLEIFAKYGLKGTFNLNSGLLRPDDAPDRGEATRENMWTRLRLSEAVRLFKDSGQEVAVHGVLHRDFAYLSAPECAYEVSEDKKRLENLFETVIRGSAYPMGGYSAISHDVLPTCGIVYGRTVKATHGFDLPTDWIELHPTCHHGDPELMPLAEHFVNDRRTECGMFYVWGHACEFPVHGNWSAIENLAAYMGEHADAVWFATNIEIYDYVHAFAALEHSADGSLVYNPTATTVWFTFDGAVRKVAPGETLRVF